MNKIPVLTGIVAMLLLYGNAVFEAFRRKVYWVIPVFVAIMVLLGFVGVVSI